MMKEIPRNIEPLTDTTDVCRDYLRNRCNRDICCKFRHLTVSDLDLVVDTQMDPASANTVYEFCHDYLNNVCERQFCKFIHCNESVRAEYMETGRLPLRCKYEFELGVQDIAMFIGSGNVEPIHANSGQELLKPMSREFMPPRHGRRGKKGRFSNHHDQNVDLDTRMNGGRSWLNHDQVHMNNVKNSENKRLRLLPSDQANDETTYGQDHEAPFNISRHVAPQPDMSAVRYIEEENIMLRKEVADLRKQVSGLSATNEVLLEQNAQFRLQKRCLVEGGTATFSHGSAQAPMSVVSVPVPIAMSLSVPRANQQLSNNAGITATPLLTSEALTVTPVELVNSRPTQHHALNTVSVMPHASVPAQIQISRSIPQNSAGIVSNIVTNDSHLLNDLQTNQLVVQRASRNITVQTDEESLSRINRNMATAQMTHSTLVTGNQQNQSSAGPPSGNLPAFAAQVITAQGPLATGNAEIGTAQISVPAVPCGSLASAIVPVTITTTLPVSAMVPTLSLDNQPASIIATRMDGMGAAQQHVGRVSMGSSCPNSVVTVSLAQPGHPVVNTMGGRHVVGGQQQIGTPINIRINQVPPPGQQQPGPGLRAALS